MKILKTTIAGIIICLLSLGAFSGNVTATGIENENSGIGIYSQNYYRYEYCTTQGWFPSSLSYQHLTNARVSGVLYPTTGYQYKSGSQRCMMYSGYVYYY